MLIKLITVTGVLMMLNLLTVFAADDVNGRMTFTTSAVSASSSSASSSEGTKDKKFGEYFDAFLKYVKEKYKDEVSEEKLLTYAFKGMLSNLDKYSEFFTPQEASSFLGGVEGAYKGIGVVITKNEDDSITIDRVFNDTPAEKGGLIEGDRIISIDGTLANDLTVDEAATLIKGKEGTSVDLKILRVEKMKEFTIYRADVKVNPVSYRIIKDIGFIKLDAFNHNSSSAMQDILNIMDEKNIKKIVLDLRNNPGGEVSQVVNIAKNFIPKGLITRLEFRTASEQNEEYYSELPKLKYDLVVLVNKNSASASEILAGAIQDSGAGKIVGTVTYGKSRVQKVYPIINKAEYEKSKKTENVEIIDGFELNQKLNYLFDEDAIFGWAKITIGEYFTPKGRKIDGKGIEPDYPVEDAKELRAKIARIIVPLKKEKKFDLGDEDSQILMTERILNLAGYNVLEPDSIYDKESFEAIAKFQTDNKLFVYGKIDYATQNKLNEKLEELIQQLDKQYAKAFEILQ